MPKRMPLLVAVILAIVVAAVASTSRPSRAERAAGECLARPGSAAPQGSHWYYRVDRSSMRRCWYLGPVGAQMRRAAVDSCLDAE